MKKLILSYWNILEALRLTKQLQESFPSIAELRAELQGLKAQYLQETHTIIEPHPHSKSLAYWREYVKLQPSFLTEARKKRIAYAKQTRVEFEISEKLHAFIMRNS